MKKCIHRILIIIFSISIALVFFLGVFNKTSEFEINDDLSIRHNWKITVGLNKKKEKIVTFENIICKDNIFNPHILITSHIPVEIYLDEKLIKCFPAIKEEIDTKVVNIAWHIAELHDDCLGKKIRLEFRQEDFQIKLNEYLEDMESSRYEVSGIMIGTKTELLNKIILMNAKYLIFSSFFIVAAVLIIILCCIAKVHYKYKTNFCYIAAGLLSFSCWILCESQLLLFLLSNAQVYYLKQISIFSIPIFMFTYTAIEFDTTNKKYIKIINVVQIWTTIIAVLLHIFQILELNIIITAMWTVLALNQSLCIIFLIPDVPHNIRIRNVFVGYIIYYITVSIYSFMLVNAQSLLESKYLVIGLFLFFAYFSISLINEFLNIIRKINEITIIQMQSEQQTCYYKMLEKNDSALKKIVHDIKNHWFILERLLDEGNYLDASTYSKEIISNLNLNRKGRVISTGNSFFDAILTIKIQYAEQKNIKVETEIMVVKNMKISKIDYSIIFGNILDNAIEACENIENKWIEIKIFYKKNMLICKITNSANTGALSRSTIETTKKNKSMHGFGISNVKEVIEKYNGDFELKSNSGMATATLILYNV